MKIHKLQNSCVRKVQQEQRKQGETGHEKKPLCLPCTLPVCTSAQYAQGCCWLARRGIHKQLQTAREKPANLMTPAAARWLRSWHKSPPLQILPSAEAMSFSNCMTQEQ